MMQMLTYNSHTRCRAITNYKYVNDIIIRMTLRRDRLKITRQIPGKVPGKVKLLILIKTLKF